MSHHPSLSTRHGCRAWRLSHITYLSPSHRRRRLLSFHSKWARRDLSMRVSFYRTPCLFFCFRKSHSDWIRSNWNTHFFICSFSIVQNDQFSSSSSKPIFLHGLGVWIHLDSLTSFLCEDDLDDASFFWISFNRPSYKISSSSRGFLPFVICKVTGIRCDGGKRG